MWKIYQRSIKWHLMKTGKSKQQVKGEKNKRRRPKERTLTNKEEGGEGGVFLHVSQNLLGIY